MEEVWKDIKGYEGLYQVSNLGRIKSLKRFKKNHSKLQKVNEKILKLYINKRNGYVYRNLNKNSLEKNHRVHRLVAETFIPNPNNLPQINHKDGNKQNNCVDNLEWCTCKENMQHAYKLGLANNNNQKIKVLQYDLKNNLIAKYDSLLEASKQTNISISNISLCINGKQKTTHNFIFKEK